MHYCACTIVHAPSAVSARYNDELQQLCIDCKINAVEDYSDVLQCVRLYAVNDGIIQFNSRIRYWNCNDDDAVLTSVCVGYR